METGADEGQSFTMNLREGVNEYKLVIEIPTPLDLTHNEFTDAWRYCQLTLYPNPFSSTFKVNKKVTKVLGSGESSPRSQVDLLYNSPRDLRYWAWGRASDQSFLLLNTNTTTSPDLNLGYLDSGAIRPNLAVSYDSAGGGINDPITLQAALTSKSRPLTPLIRKMGLLTR